MMSFAYIILIDEIYFNLKRKMSKCIFISFIDRMRRKACGIIEEKKRVVYDGVLYLPIV
jgi:hypothetical protein